MLKYTFFVLVLSRGGTLLYANKFTGKTKESAQNSAEAWRRSCESGMEFQETIWHNRTGYTQLRGKNVASI